MRIWISFALGLLILASLPFIYTALAPAPVKKKKEECLQYQEPCTSGTPVIANNDGYWASGIIVGTMSSKILNNPEFIASGEAEFLAGGGGTRQMNKFPPEYHQVTVEKEEMREKLSNMDQRSLKRPVVLRYGYPFIQWPPFGVEMTYLVSEIDSVTSYRKTNSYRDFADGARETKPLDWLFTSGGKVGGLIIHVSRWARWPYQHRCTIFIHRGGMREESREQYYQNTVPYTDPKTNELKTRQETRMQMVTEKVPNVVIMSTFNEDICSYAEDAAVSLTPVTVEYDGTEDFSVTDISGAMIKAIKVMRRKKN